MNVLNSTINNVGLNVLAKFDTFSIKDFKNSRGIYLINTPITSISIQKNLELKLLDYFYVAENSNLALIEQNPIPENFIFIYGYFVLCVKYPKIFGKFLINFLEKNADKEILKLIQPSKKEFPINKKKLALKKRKFDRKHFQKRKRKNLNFKTRRYSTTRKVTTLYEVYASIKTAAWPEGDFIDQSKVMEVGKTLDNTEGVSPSAAFDILDKCAANPELCSFFYGAFQES